MNLSYLGLTGEIPKEIVGLRPHTASHRKLMNLQRLYLDNNQLTGEIPKDIVCLRPHTASPRKLTNLQ